MIDLLLGLTKYLGRLGVIIMFFYRISEGLCLFAKGWCLFAFYDLSSFGGWPQLDVFFGKAEEPLTSFVSLEAVGFTGVCFISESLFEQMDFHNIRKVEHGKTYSTCCDRCCDRCCDTKLSGAFSF